MVEKTNAYLALKNLEERNLIKIEKINNENKELKITIIENEEAKINPIFCTINFDKGIVKIKLRGIDDYILHRFNINKETNTLSLLKRAVEKRKDYNENKSKDIGAERSIIDESPKNGAQETRGLLRGFFRNLGCEKLFYIFFKVDREGKIQYFAKPSLKLFKKRNITELKFKKASYEKIEGDKTKYKKKEYVDSIYKYEEENESWKKVK